VPYVGLLATCCPISKTLIDVRSAT
jgi:NAD(P)-dependent dehydrogenase (short-subunit alcohol dehydrogenase family)